MHHTDKCLIHLFFSSDHYDVNPGRYGPAPEVLAVPGNRGKLQAAPGVLVAVIQDPYRFTGQSVNGDKPGVPDAVVLEYKVKIYFVGIDIWLAMQIESPRTHKPS